jgi:hypothetical protein
MTFKDQCIARIEKAASDLMVAEIITPFQQVFFENVAAFLLPELLKALEALEIIATNQRRMPNGFGLGVPTRSAERARQTLSEIKKKLGVE